MLARAAAGALCALALCPAAAAAQPQVLVVLVPGPQHSSADPPAPDPLLRALAARPQLAVGLMSPTQGTYTPEQALLDITQGARASPTAYEPRPPPSLSLHVTLDAGGVVGWPAAVRRAATAPGGIVPGRLASSLPGGAAFAGVQGEPEGTAGAVIAADRRGQVAAVWLGSEGELLERARLLGLRHRLTVVQLTARGDPLPLLDRLLATRAPDELVIVLQTPPQMRHIPLLPIAVASGGSARRGLTSHTTRTAGIVAGIDLLPTILRHLGRRVPAAVTGQQIRFVAPRAAGSLEALRTRYTHPAPRRIRTFAVMVVAAALLLGTMALLGGAAEARRALRLDALTFMWAPAFVLVPAAVDPESAVVEIALVTGGALVAAAVTDRLAPWPRGPLAPAAVCLVAYTVDLAASSQLVDLSLLGPNPRSGARFFGIGNELEPALPILMFAGLAAAFGSRPRSRRMAAAFAGLGALLAVVVGSGYVGADVGGVITVSAGTAAATLAVLPGGVTRRGLALAACVPVASVVLLALLDLATGASTHFTRNVLLTEGGGLGEIVARRYEFAYQALVRGLMPVVFALAVIMVAVGLAWRRRLYADLPGPAWRAALLGALAVGVVGALTNDSGPLLFVVAVLGLAVLTAYLQGRPGVGDTGDSRVGGASGVHTPPMRESPPADPSGGGRPPATVP